MQCQMSPQLNTNCGENGKRTMVSRELNSKLSAKPTTNDGPTTIPYDGTPPSTALRSAHAHKLKLRRGCAKPHGAQIAAHCGRCRPTAIRPETPRGLFREKNKGHPKRGGPCFIITWIIVTASHIKKNEREPSHQLPFVCACAVPHRPESRCPTNPNQPDIHQHIRSGNTRQQQVAKLTMRPFVMSTTEQKN